MIPKKIIRGILVSLLAMPSLAQQNIPVPDNLVTEGIPALPVTLVSDVKSYTESRGASLVEWHPLKKEMLIGTRFGNSNQIHHVAFPGGDRKQLTFFDEPVGSATFDPVAGSYFLFLKDIGGNEFSQIYRYDFSNKKITLLTNGKRSQNGGIRWSEKGDRIAYGSTQRNGKDRDIFVMNPLDSASKKLVAQNTGGGWGVVDWSVDDSKLLISEGISVNESRLYMLDLATGNKTRLLPEKDERSSFSGIALTEDGKGLYLITNKDNEFNRLAYYELANKKINYITNIPWDVEDAELSKDGKQLAFITNENGVSKLYILSTANNQYSAIANLPTGVMGGVSWSGDSKSVGITYVTYNSSSDVYEYNTDTKALTRWTESELGGMDISTLQEPKLITWKTFDGKNISGFLYKASSKFTGKRPVVINIHGGPEGQSLPVFQGRSNYFLNELGVSIIYPNVRGSTGYGKTFVDLDNGVKREESVKDIGALIDWIAQQPDLDKDRIMITGGSYGGYMTLAVAYLYSDKIRCSLDVVGISNFNTFMKNTEAYRRDLRRVEYGDERDPKMAEFFEKIAPLNHTDKIKKPLFIVQGGNDPRVPYTESIQMKDKIKQNGGTVWFLMAKDEGHGFRKKNNADFQFYATIAFVKQFLLN
ncbi:S9 family peptidase [Chryseosolibacter indicus]|uniref:S9 family peptidase n=1 Tax=Chryseosolibacter indicus TaxID=2782351 RepID=A0ABS5VMT3_9BACT|nr:S9 family peptidase [Chryseosolibacter indicus]MBT1702759.1 S9 family peptidase [Chryseosolibacter indicus]